jgi:hypothetical protein
VCWKWKAPNEYRSQFTGGHVNILKNMIKRNLSIPYIFSCITDDVSGIDTDVNIISLWHDYANIPNPYSTKNPSCYRRLKAFSREAKELIGERIFSLDLDCVITSNIDHLVDRDDDFVCWGDTAKGTHYNGGLWLLKTGTRTQVWDTFNPVLSPQITRNKNIIGSDQAWISYCLQGKDPKWTTEDGVYSYRNHIRTSGKGLPSNACIIMFHGQYDPWQPQIYNQYQWVKDNYR